MENNNGSRDATRPVFDVVDDIVGLQPGDALYETRHAREKVVSATQASYELFFDPAMPGIPLHERLLVALHASQLSQSNAMAGHYRKVLAGLAVDPAALAAVEAGDLSKVPGTGLRAMLVFTQTLITRPIEGDEAALKQLQAAGLSTPDVVTLAQLVAFLSYQIRLVAGLAAMKASESQ